MPHPEVRVVPKATNAAPDLHNAKIVTPAGPRGGSGGEAGRTTEHSGAQQEQDWAQNRVGGAYGSGHRELAFARRVGGASEGLSHSRRLSRAVGRVSFGKAVGGWAPSMLVREPGGRGRESC